MRTRLGTIGTVARRAGTAAAGIAALAGVAGLVQREVSLRWSGSRRAVPAPTIAPTAPVAAPTPSPVGEAPAAQSPTASPALVARAVARNEAGLPRRSAATPRPRRRSVPGARLPARAGQGIIGV